MRINSYIIHIQMQITIVFCISFVPPIICQSETDTIYLNETLLLGKVTISNTRDFLTIHSGERQTFSAIEVERISFANGNEAISVFIPSESRAFFAEKVYDGEIDVFQLDLRQRGNLFYLRKDGRVDALIRGNLESFYNVYFAECYLPIPDKKFGYSRSDIVYMVRLYQTCATGEDTGIVYEEKSNISKLVLGLRFNYSRIQAEFQSINYFRNVIFYEHSFHPAMGLFLDFTFSDKFGMDFGISVQSIDLYTDSLVTVADYVFNDIEIEINSQVLRFPVFLYYQFNLGTDFAVALGPQALLGFPMNPEINQTLIYSTHTFEEDLAVGQKPANELGIGLRGSARFSPEGRFSFGLDFSYMRVSSEYLVVLSQPIDLKTSEFWIGLNLGYNLN